MDIKQINSLRHPGERILYLICATLNTFFAAFLILGVFFLGRTILLSGYLQNVYYVAVSAFVVAFFSMGTTFAQTRVYSVKVGENQFPKLFEIVKGFAQRDRKSVV